VRPGPLTPPFGRAGWPSLAVAVCIAAVVAAVWRRSPILAVTAATLLLVVFASVAGRRRRMRLMASAMGLAWFHPDRGQGALAWRDVGALIVRDDGGTDGLAVWLVPREAGSVAGRPAAAFSVSAGDLGLRRAEAEDRLRAFVSEVLPRLPHDVVLDRETRRRLADWRIEAPSPDGGSAS
jgi:hypothetical protein